MRRDEKRGFGAPPGERPEEGDDDVMPVEDELDPEDDEDILDPVGEPDGFPDVDED